MPTSPSWFRASASQALPSRYAFPPTPFVRVRKVCRMQSMLDRGSKPPRRSVCCGDVRVLVKSGPGNVIDAAVAATICRVPSPREPLLVSLSPPPSTPTNPSSGSVCQNSEVKLCCNLQIRFLHFLMTLQKNYALLHVN